MILTLILLASRSINWRLQGLIILLTAVVFHLFQWWYDKPLFVVLFPWIFFLAMLMAGHPFKTILVSAGLFIFLIGPINFFQCLWPVAIETLTRMDLMALPLISDESRIYIPDTHDTIQELNKSSLLTSLKRIMG